jgi:AraC-like DNA-binding protein
MFIFYNYSLLLGWITLFVLAVILYVPTDRKKYTKTYTRSRRFCGTSFLSFGIGIFLQWYFHPRVSNPFVARALYATYFCLGSVFFSTSHITLINPHYQCKRKCAVDTLSLVLSLSLMWSGAVQHINYLLSSGECVFFLYLSHLCYVFFHSYFDATHRLSDLTTEEVDLFVKWLLFSVYLMIFFAFMGVTLNIIFDYSLIVGGLVMDAGTLVFIYIAWTYMGYIRHLDTVIPMLEEPDSDPSVVFDSATYREVCLRIDAWIRSGGYTQENINILELASIVASNRTYVSCYFHDKGDTFHNYIIRLRIRDAKQLLQNPHLTVEDVGSRIGYSRTHFIRMFRSITGMTPSEYRDKLG